MVKLKNPVIGVLNIYVLVILLTYGISFFYLLVNMYIRNPKLPCYIELRLTDFKNILNGGYIGNELSLRNNDKIRKLFAEIITIICLSKKILI